MLPDAMMSSLLLTKVCPTSELDPQTHLESAANEDTSTGIQIDTRYVNPSMIIILVITGRQPFCMLLCIVACLL